MAFIAIWKRPLITKACFDGLMRHKRKHNIDVFCVVSEKWAIDLCEAYGFKYCVTENKPIGQKMNKGLEKVLEYNFDYLLQMNSDTLLAEEFFDVYDWDKDYMGSCRARCGKAGAIWG